MRIKVGLVGYGLSGAIFHAPLIQSVDQFELAAVVSSAPAKVKQDLPHVKVVPTLAELLQDPEIKLVVITSPNETHCPYAKEAILADKHLVVEKPFVVQSTEGVELVELARQRGVVLSVFQNRRWDNDFLTIRRLLSEKTLGELYQYEAHFDRYRAEVGNKWKEQETAGAGVLYDLGAHLIDQALVLFGPPRSVWADLKAQRPGARVSDYFHLVLDYGRLSVTLRAGSVVRRPGPRFQLHGAGGSFLKHGLDPQENQLKAGLRPGQAGWGEDPADLYGQLVLDRQGAPAESQVPTLPGEYQVYYQELARAITTGAPVPVSPADAIHTIRIIEYAMRSHADGRVIPYP